MKCPKCSHTMEAYQRPTLDLKQINVTWLCTGCLYRCHSLTPNPHAPMIPQEPKNKRRYRWNQEEQ